MDIFSQINQMVNKKFLIFILSLQLASLGIIGFDSIGLNIPFIRPVVEFTYLSFVPGLLILRILKVRDICTTDIILYSVGLSISIVMFLGFILNNIAPFFGISYPISIFPLTVSIGIIVLFLCGLLYISDMNTGEPNVKYTRVYKFSNSGVGYSSHVFSPDVLFLLLIPLLSIFGSYLMNSYKINLLSLLLIILIALIVILIGFDKFIQVNSYPLAVFTISLSLLYHTSLISMYLWGTDIHLEYYFSNNIINLGIWNPYAYGHLNSILTDSVLNPVYSILLNIDLKWIFKIFTPFLFSFVPLTVYQIFRKQTNEKVAFFASFFLMAESMFYTIMLEVPRQQIAELFVVLIILTFTDKDLNSSVKSFLIVLFSLSLTVSHYGIAYLYFFSLLISWILLKVNELYRKFSHSNVKLKESDKRENVTIQADVDNLSNSNVKFTLVLLVFVFTLSWYIYNSGSSVFESIIHIFENFMSSVHTGIFDPNEVEGLRIATMETVSPLHLLNKYVHLVSLFFISIGILSMTIKHLYPNINEKVFDEIKLNSTYFAFSIVLYIFCFSSLVFPSTSSVMGTSRVYYACLILLSLFSVIGYTVIVNISYSLCLKGKSVQYITRCKDSFSIFLVIFLFLSSGFLYELAKDNSTSIGLNSSDKEYRVVYNDGDFKGVTWLLKYIESNDSIYVGSSEKFIMYEFLPKTKVNNFLSSTSQIADSSYIVLDPLNLKNQILDTYFRTSGFAREYSELNKSVFFGKVLVFSNKIYDNGVINIHRSIS